MAYTEDGYFSVAAVNSPLTASTANSLLRDADPAIFFLLDFYAGVIGLHLGARWNAEVTLAGRPDLVGLSVADKVPFDPVPYFQENQYKFPLLAAFRKNETYEWKTASFYHITSTLNVLWVLPPVTAGQAERMNPFRAHVARTLVDRSSFGYDTNYNAGELVWREAGIEKIVMKGSQYGNIPDVNSDLYLPTVLMEVEMTERRMNTSNDLNFEPLTGVENEYDI